MPGGRTNWLVQSSAETHCPATSSKDRLLGHWNAALHIMLHIIIGGWPHRAGHEVPQSFHTWPPQSSPWAQLGTGSAESAVQSISKSIPSGMAHG